jgi:hypothetical protein
MNIVVVFIAGLLSSLILMIEIRLSTAIKFYFDSCKIEKWEKKSVSKKSDVGNS